MSATPHSVQKCEFQSARIERAGATPPRYAQNLSNITTESCSRLHPDPPSVAPTRTKREKLRTIAPQQAPATQGFPFPTAGPAALGSEPRRVRRPVIQQLELRGIAAGCAKKRPAIPGTGIV